MACDFQQILNEVRNCTICENSLPLGCRPVLQLHPGAKLLIVGQAPGSKVHKTGIPFDDPSGNRLREWMGVDRHIFYDAQKVAILPMGFCYPGKGKSGDLPPRKECAEHWREKLLALLPNIELTLVIGQYAIDYHLKDRDGLNLTQTVQNWKEYWPEMLPMPHPSPRNNIWLKKNSWFEYDVVPLLRQKVSSLI